MEYRKHQHSVFLLTYHAVFVVKYRRKVIDREIMDYMEAMAKRLMQGYGGSLIEFNGEEDHIHLLFELPPSAVPSRIVCSLKTQLSKYVRAEFGERIRDKLWKDSFWSDSYFLTTTGGANIETIEWYIQNQGIDRPKRKYTKRTP